jgi:predicted nucleic acid-binding protein
MIYKIMTSIACNAIKRKYPITEYEIVDLVRNLDRDTSNRYATRHLNVEASRAIEFAYRNV